MGASNHLTVEVDMKLSEESKEIIEKLHQEPEWAIWIYRNGSGYQLPFKVNSETREGAWTKANDSINRVLDAVGISFKREAGYTVEVRKLIE